MASHVFVIDSALKRTQVKVSPGKYLREVLEEACKARKLDPDSYTLKAQNNKPIDLSQQFRLSGLSPGAKLQLTQASKSTGVVNVALQLPDSEGGRLQDKFPSTTSLWLVLRKFEDAVAGQPPRKLNLTQRGVPPDQSTGSGRLEYEQPVLNVMGRNLETFSDLQKSLGQLGFNSGSVLLRMSYRNNGQPLEEAMKEIGQYFSAADSALPAVSAVGSTTQETRAAHAAANGNTESVPDADANTESNSAPEPAEPTSDVVSGLDATTAHTVEKDHLASASETPLPKQPSPAQSRPSNVVNGISVFRPPSSSTPAAALHEEDPKTFEPTIEHAKAHQADLERRGKNKRLLSTKEEQDQAAAQQAKLDSIHQVGVRVRYPDQSSIKTSITADDTSADLYARIMGTLAHAPEPFELRYFDTKNQHHILPNSTVKRMIKDFGISGNSLVTMTWAPDASLEARQPPCLKPEYYNVAQDLKVELQSQQAAGEENHRSAMAKKDTASAPSAGKGSGDIESKLKRFMGFGKK